MLTNHHVIITIGELLPNANLCASPPFFVLRKAATLDFYVKSPDLNIGAD